MYRSIYQSSALDSALQAVRRANVEQTPQDLLDTDHLVHLVQPTEVEPELTDQQIDDLIGHLPFDWLKQLRLLQGVPLTYLVPDPELLPPESIRFFDVDRNWIDRLVDGALSASNIGCANLAFSVSTLATIRKLLDDQLTIDGQVPWVDWNPRQDPMTGMLIRSELVTRWPNMLIDAYLTPAMDDEVGAHKIHVLRRDVLSKSLLLVLFAGRPGGLTIREPFTGVRFGIDDFEKDSMILRDRCGQEITGETIEKRVYVASSKLPKLTQTTISGVTTLKTNDIYHGMVAYWTEKPPAPAPAPNFLPIPVSTEDFGSRDIALQLTQAPYVQRFTSDTPASAGYKGAIIRPHLDIQATGKAGIRPAGDAS